MIRKVNRFFIPRLCSASSTAFRRLSPEEDALIIGSDDNDIDETLPADLWFHSRSRKRSGRASRIIA